MVVYSSQGFMAPSEIFISSNWFLKIAKCSSIVILKIVCKHS